MKLFKRQLWNGNRDNKNDGTSYNLEQADELWNANHCKRVVYYCVLTCVCMVVCSVIAGTAEIELKTVRAKGEGNNRAESIQFALIEAVSKTTGITLDAAITAKLVSIERSNGKSSSYQSQDAYKSEINKLTKGVVSSWEVIKEEQKNNLYFVELSVTVANTKFNDAHAARKSIAVLPFRVIQSGAVFDRMIPNNVLSKAYQESLITYLTSSRKFAVIDETFKDEIDTVLESTVKNEDVLRGLLRKANQLGVEYLAVGIGENFIIKDESVIIVDSSATFKKCEGLVRLRVLEVESRQTVLAADFRLERLPQQDLTGQNPENGILDTLGKQMSARILDTIYPIRVADINDENEVILDRGGETMAVGDIYGVYKLGDRLIDSSTGESLGFQETFAGTIELIRVLQKVSYAKIVDVKTSIKANHVCRRLVAETNGKIIKKRSERNSSPVDELFK